MDSKLNFIIEERRKIHGRKPLNLKFKTLASGSYGDMSWDKDDVGSVTKNYNDRHGFNSVFIRFKGQKTGRVVPTHVFRKFFKTIDDTEADPSKWANSEKGGTKVSMKNRKKKDHYSKQEISDMIKKTTKKVNEDHDILLEKSSKERYSVGIKKDSKPPIYELRKHVPGVNRFVQGKRLNYIIMSTSRFKEEIVKQMLKKRGKPHEEQKPEKDKGIENISKKDQDSIEKAREFQKQKDQADLQNKNESVLYLPKISRKSHKRIQLLKGSKNGK